MPQSYIQDFANVAFFVILGALFAILMLFLPRLLAPSDPNPEKLSTYECGMRPISEVWSQLHVRYYIFALLFLIFDVEAVFLYPWAVMFSKLGIVALIEMIIFIVVLAVGLVYAWGKGVLTWA